MTLKLEYTEDVGDLYAYLRSYETNFLPYDDNGWFNTSIYNGQIQWGAGVDNTDIPPTGNSSVIMDIDNYDYSPGVFDGDVDGLRLGQNIWHDDSADLWKQTDELFITNLGGGFTPNTTAFQQAIYALSHGGAVDGGVFSPGPFPMTFLGLTDYFAEQGTYQLGSAEDDVLLSFAGDDSLEGNGADFLDMFLWNADYYETTGVVSDANGLVKGWGDDTIVDFVDERDFILLEGFGWSDFTDFQNAGGSITGNVITYSDSVNSLVSTITVNFDGGGSLSELDLLFA
jgi:hypothetical protein